MKARNVLMAAAAAALATAGVATAASPVTGTISGPVTAVQTGSYTLKSSLSPTGSSKVHVGSATTITEQVAGTKVDLKKGVCVAAFGSKDKSGVVAAQRITLSSPVKGRCQNGFGGGPGGRRPPAGAPNQPPPQGYQRSGPPGNFGNFGFAAGGIAAINGSTLTVHNQQGSTRVTVSSKTQMEKTVNVPFSAIKVGMCTFVRGTSSDKGVNVTAQSIGLFKSAGSNGCSGGFRRP